jgi:hypothetical protein
VKVPEPPASAAEIAALDKTITVLPEKTGNVTAGVYGGETFLQLMSDPPNFSLDDARQFELAKKIRYVANKHPSSELSKLVTSIESLVQTSQGPDRDVFKSSNDQLQASIDKKGET